MFWRELSSTGPGWLLPDANVDWSMIRLIAITFFLIMTKQIKSTTHKTADQGLELVFFKIFLFLKRIFFRIIDCFVFQYLPLVSFFAIIWHSTILSIFFQQQNNCTWPVFGLVTSLEQGQTGPFNTIILNLTHLLSARSLCGRSKAPS